MSNIDESKIVKGSIITVCGKYEKDYLVLKRSGKLLNVVEVMDDKPDYSPHRINLLGDEIVWTSLSSLGYVYMNRVADICDEAPLESVDALLCAIAEYLEVPGKEVTPTSAIDGEVISHAKTIAEENSALKLEIVKLNAKCEVFETLLENAIKRG